MWRKTDYKINFSIQRFFNSGFTASKPDKIPTFALTVKYGHY